MSFNKKMYEEKMQKAINAYESTLDTIRAGRANTAILSKITFEYYGAPTLLVNMADVKVTDPKTVSIIPYDKSTFKAIIKAIMASDIGITPSDDGSVIRLVFPQLTGERRKELIKQVQKEGEECKVAIRNVRRAANDDIKKLKKDGELTEDEQKSTEKSVQELTDKYIKNVDGVTEKKIAELNEI
ncbi:MAG: ribosome recycling factor [Clostridia bacterium]|nr:ribosome recycling factor [Clostridia bacterium]MDY3784900.1 ribosome recycling factor [Eubacteriales bacterium]